MWAEVSTQERSKAMSRRIRHIRWLLVGLGLAVLSIPAAATAGGSNQRFGPPDGWYGYAVSLTQQQRQQHRAVLDGRSPDTRDAANAFQLQSSALLDGRSPDTIDAALTAQSERSTPVDGRSPDTIDFAAQARSPVPTVFSTPGF